MMTSVQILLIISLFVNLSVLLLILFLALGGWQIFLEKQIKIRADLLSSLADFNRGDSIVFLGDSITEYFPIKELFPKEYIVNRGIGGDTTDGVLKRLKGNVLQINPKKLFILLAVNDLGRTRRKIPYILQNYRKILNSITNASPETKIYVEAILPTNPNIKAPGSKLLTRHRKNSDIWKINRMLAELCHDTGCTFIDTAGPMSDESGNLKTNYTKEGLHLSPAGYKALADILTPFVKE